MSKEMKDEMKKLMAETKKNSKELAEESFKEHKDEVD